jgi:hypothetical protein
MAGSRRCAWSTRRGKLETKASELADSRPEVRRFVRMAVLDGLAVSIAQLDLDPAAVGIEVATGPDLEPVRASAGGAEVRVELRGVEVQRLVAEVAATVDVEHPDVGRHAVEQRVEQGVELGRGEEVLAVGARLERGVAVELVEPHAVEVVDLHGCRAHRDAPMRASPDRDVSMPSARSW